MSNLNSQQLTRPMWPYQINSLSDQARDLVAWLPFPTGLLDSLSGAGRRLIPAAGILPPAYTPDALPALAFNGTSVYYNLSDITPITANAPLTISCWMRHGGAPGGVAVFVGSDGWTNASYLAANFPSGTVSAASAASLTFASADSTTALSSGRWYHIAAVYAGAANRKIYVNGVLEATDTTNRAIGAPSGARIGAGSANPGIANFFTGDLADIRIATRAYTDAEVFALYNPATRFDLYWSPWMEAATGAVPATPQTSAGGFNVTIGGA